ncbi:MAG: hypothetical protein AABP62_01555 [Planctomycetota bacterium]
MIFPYSVVVSQATGSADYFLFRRPEIPITITGTKLARNFLGLVDTGSDHTIVPLSVARGLGVVVDELEETTANVFGGQSVLLRAGEVELRLEADGKTITWSAIVSFFDFPSEKDETVVLGHAGFLEFFTSTFDGELEALTLVPNRNLPVEDHA